MDQAALSRLLDDLIARWESEVVEFKQAGMRLAGVWRG